MPGEPLPPRRVAIAAWGALGFAALLVKALIQLTPLALVPLRDYTLDALHIAVYVAWVAWMAWTEGYKTFQQVVAPRVAARAMHLARNPRPWHVALAPFYCMALFHATRKRMIVSWAVVVMVVGLVIGVRFLPQPWRGIIDGGVVVGLAWGLIAIVVCFGRALAGRPVPADPGLPV